MDTYFCPSLGWGKTTDAGISTETLQTTEVPIVEKSKCKERMNQEELEAGDENLLVCTGGTGVGPCKVEKKTLPKAQGTRGLSSSCQSNFLRSYHKS